MTISHVETGYFFPPTTFISHLDPSHAKLNERHTITGVTNEQYRDVKRNCENVK